MIYQGARELDLRKKDLVEDIQGVNRIPSSQYWYYLISYFWIIENYKNR